MYILLFLILHRTYQLITNLFSCKKKKPKENFLNLNANFTQQQKKKNRENDTKRRKKNNVKIFKIHI